MTKTEALKQAKRQWGTLAHVGEDRCGGAPLPLSAQVQCPLHAAIGCKRRRRFVGDGSRMMGHGETYHAAFQDAARRAARVSLLEPSVRKCTDRPEDIVVDPDCISRVRLVALDALQYVRALRESRRADADKALDKIISATVKLEEHYEGPPEPRKAKR